MGLSMNKGPSNSGEISQNERLEGWKEIATHLKRGLRTVQRWERKGLPIHRHDALGVHAYKEELDSWLSSHPIEKQQEDAGVLPEDIKPEMAAAAASTSSQKWARPRLVLIVCVALGVGLPFFLIGDRGKQTDLPQLGPRSLAVLGFRNLTGRTEVAWLSTALSEMLTAELAAGGKLNPVSGEDVIRVKRDLSLAEADGFSKETLDRIRKYLGPGVVLSGSYVSLGKETARQIRLQLILQDTETGETIATLSETGTEGLLFDLVSRTGALLRGKLRVGEVPASEALNPKGTLPRNLEAQRLYSEGLNKLRLDQPAAARDALERAVRADPNYALGHSVLADAWSVLGYEDKAKEQANIAFTLSSTLAPEEALSIEAKYRESAKDWSRSVEIYQKLCQFSPNSLEYRLRLVKSQTSGGKGKEALTTLAEIRKLPSRISEDPRIDLAEALIAESLGDFKREQAAAARGAAKGRSRGMRLLTARAHLRECWAF